MPTTQAVVVDPASAARFVIREFPFPEALPYQAIVRVKAISLNPGEIRYSMSAPAGRRPGWDLAGVVHQAAADGSGPKAGVRVVGMLNLGSWAQFVAIPTNSLAELPDSISFAQAATLPVAGLTALHSLSKGGFLLQQPVLVTGATGGTGGFICQLAKLAGARVVATVRSKDREKFARDHGADQVIVGDDPSGAAQFGPYPLIIDSVAGPNFGKILAMVASRGICVIFGAIGGTEPVINAAKFYQTGSTTLYGFILFQELNLEPAGLGLRRLVELVSAGKLKTHIDLEESWTKIADITQKLTARSFVGKAVLHVD